MNSPTWYFLSLEVPRETACRPQTRTSRLVTTTDVPSLVPDYSLVMEADASGPSVEGVTFGGGLAGVDSAEAQPTSDEERGIKSIGGGEPAHALQSIWVWSQCTANDRQ